MAFTRSLPLSGLALASLVLVVAAQNPSFSSISSQCVDASGFSTCWANATSTASTCYGAVTKCTNSGSCTDENNCSSTAADCTTNCVCGAYTNWINCALTHCWNKIYSCEYQNLALEAAAHCTGAGTGPLNTNGADGYIPYVPAPSGAAGGCSCDISYVLYRHGASKDHAAACAARVANGTITAPSPDGRDGDRCACCAASEAVSAFYNTCPSTAPAAVPLFAETVGQSLATLRGASCAALLVSGGYDCRKLGFEKPGLPAGPFLSADDLPANGTASLSDAAGNTVASPVGGPTLVWQLGQRFPNVTAVAASATATAAGGATTSASSKNAAARPAGDLPVAGLVSLLGLFGLGMALL